MVDCHVCGTPHATKQCPPSPRPTPLYDTDIAVNSLIRLAEWARNNRFVIADVTIGSLSLKIRDLKIDDLESIKRAYPEQKSLLEEAGMTEMPEDGTIG